MHAEVVAHLVADDTKRHRAVDPARRARQVRETGPATAGRLRERVHDVLVRGEIHACGRGLRASLAGPGRVRAARVRRVDRVPAVHVAGERELPVRRVAEVLVHRVRVVEDDAPHRSRCPRLREVVREVEEQHGDRLRSGHRCGGRLRRRLHAAGRGEDAVPALSVRANLASRERLHGLSGRLERDEPRDRRVDAGSDVDRRRERVAVPGAECAVERLLRLPGGEAERHAHERERKQGEHDEATASAHGSQPRRLLAQVNDPSGSSLGRGSAAGRPIADATVHQVND